MRQSIINNPAIQKRENRAYALFSLAAFVFLMVFYCNVHPIVLLDADDWTYISCSRAAIPSLRFWNPCRILPEVLMPLCGSLAAHLLYPLTGEYLRSVSLMCALFVSTFTVLYLRAFLYLLQKRAKLSPIVNCMLGAVFLVLHFMVYRTQMENNYHLLYSYSATGYFYYNIPILLNAALAMYFWGSGILQNFFDGQRLIFKGFLLCAIYFAVFSNLFGSIVLLAWLCVSLFWEIVAALRIKEKLLPFARRNLAAVLLLILWLFSALLELSGDRAGEVSVSDTPLLQRIAEVAKNLLAKLASANRPMLLLLVGLAVGAVLVFLLRKRAEKGRKTEATSKASSDTAPEAAAEISAADKNPVSPVAVNETGPLLSLAVQAVLTSALVLALLIVLCACSVPGYAVRPYAHSSVWIFLFAAALLCFAFLLERLPRLICALPLLLCVLVSLTNTYSRTFVESNVLYLPSETCIALGEDLVQQVQSAVQSGETEMTLYVLDVDGGTGDNWPQTTYMGNRISTTLYKHGVIAQPIEITVERSAEINERFNVGALH